MIHPRHIPAMWLLVAPFVAATVALSACRRPGPEAPAIPVEPAGEPERVRGPHPSPAEACRQAVEENRPHLAALHQAVEAAGYQPGRGATRFNECLPAGRGVWLLAVTRMEAHGTIEQVALGDDPSFSDPVPELRAAGRWELMFFGPRGRRLSITLPAESGAGVPDRQAPNLRFRLEFEEGWDLHGDQVEPVAVFDYDGDGFGELVLLRGDWDEQSTSVTIFTTRDGGIGDYRPGRGIEIAAVEDADGDGRPDLVHNQYRMRSYCGDAALAGASDMTIAGPRVIYHSRADGTFSNTDAAAMADLERQCPAFDRIVPPAADIRRIDEAAVARNVPCARLRGATLAEVEARLRAEWPPLPACAPDDRQCEEEADCFSIDDALAYAAVEPHVRLPRR